MRHILVVDDDPHMGLAIRAWLKRYGFKVAIADGGTAGLAAIDHSTFDLMIVDIFMPYMRGFESIRMFHERAPDGAADRDFRLRLFRSGRVQSRFPAEWPSGSARRAACASLSGRRPAGVIDECLSEAEPHRRYVATLAAVANAVSEPRHVMGIEQPEGRAAGRGRTGSCDVMSCRVPPQAASGAAKDPARDRRGIACGLRST